MDRVEPATIFDPPQFAALLLRTELPPAGDAGDVAQRVAGRGEGDRAAGVLGVKIERVSQQLTILLRRGKFLAELLLRLGAHAERRPGQEAEHAVTRGIAEQGSLQLIERRILRTERPHAGHRVGIAFVHLEHRGIEQQRDVRLAHHLFQQQGVHQQWIALAIAKGVFNQQLVNHATLPGPTVVVAHVRGRPEHPQPHLAGCVSAEDRTILHEDDPNAGARGRDGRTHARQPSPHHHQVGVERAGKEGARNTTGIKNHGKRSRPLRQAGTWE